MLAKVIIPTRKTISRVKHFTILLLISIYILHQLVLQEEDIVDDGNSQGEVEKMVNHNTYTEIRKHEYTEVVKGKDSSFPINHTAGTIKIDKKVLTQLQRRARTCSFYDPLINRSSPVLCGATNFVSIVRSRCKTRLGNQLSSYAAVLYFQKKYGMIPLMEPFQMKIIKSVFEPDALSVRGLNIDTCCKSRPWKMVMALKADKRTGVATGLSEKFAKNPDYYARNFLVLLGSHTMPVFLFQGI